MLVAPRKRVRELYQRPTYDIRMSKSKRKMETVFAHYIRRVD